LCDSICPLYNYIVYHRVVGYGFWYLRSLRG
jgi:hypothetical protein